MDELTLRLECLRLACTSRSGSVTDQAETFLKWVTRDGDLQTADQAGSLSLVNYGDKGVLSPAAREKLKLPDAARRT